MIAPNIETNPYPGAPPNPPGVADDASERSLSELAAPEEPDSPRDPDAPCLGGTAHQEGLAGDEAGDQLLDPATEPVIVASDTPGVVSAAPLLVYDGTLGPAAQTLPVGVRVSVLWNENRICENWLSGRVIDIEWSLGAGGKESITSHRIKYDNGDVSLHNLLTWQVRRRLAARRNWAGPLVSCGCIYEAIGWSRGTGPPNSARPLAGPPNRRRAGICQPARVDTPAPDVWPEAQRAAHGPGSLRLLYPRRPVQLRGSHPQRAVWHADVPRRRLLRDRDAIEERRTRPLALQGAGEGETCTPTHTQTHT